MNAGYRTGALLLGALAIWSPTALKTLRGQVDFPVAALRLAASILVAWVAVWLLGRILDGYARAAGERSRPHRRKEDRATDDQNQTGHP